MTDLLTAYRSIQSLGTVGSGAITDTMRVFAVPAAGNTDPLSSALIELPDFQTHLLSTVNSQIAALQAKPGNGAFVSPITLHLTGTVTGSAAFDGSADFNLVTAIADGALGIAKVSGLATTLAALQQDIDDKGSFDPTLNIDLNNDTTASPTLSLGTADGSKMQFSYTSGIFQLDYLPSGGSPVNGMQMFTSGSVIFQHDLQTRGTLYVNGVGGLMQLSDPNNSNRTQFDNFGNISTDGSTFHSIWHDGNLPASQMAAQNRTFGTSTYYSNLAVAVSSSLGYWNASSANITGQDQFGTVLSFASDGAAAPGTSNYANQLLFGTAGNLSWRYNVNNGGWTTAKLWHSGNFTPSNYVTSGTSSVPTLGGMFLYGAPSGRVGAYLYQDPNADNLNVRVGPATGYAYHTFSTAGLLLGGALTATSTQTTAENVGTSANNWRMAVGNYGVFWRQDGTTLYLMKTASTSTPKTDSWDSTRPFVWSMVNNQITSDSAWTFGQKISISQAGTNTAISTTGVIEAINNSTTSISNGGNGASYGLLAHSGSANVPVITFLRDGQYGVYFGIETDNTLRFGGWSMGNASYRVHYDYIGNPQFNGTVYVNSDARLKEKFKKLEPRPLWRELDFETWLWKQGASHALNGVPGWGTRAQTIERVAAEYLIEDKETPVSARQGKSAKVIDRDRALIAAGKLRGVLSVDKPGMAYEMVLAAGKLIDLQAKQILALEKRLAKLEPKTKKKAA